MVSFTDQQVESAFEKAPEKIRVFIEDGELTDAASAISDSLNLPQGKALWLISLLRNMLIGLLSPRELEADLKEQGFSEEQIRVLAQQIQGKIFAAITPDAKGGPEKPEPVVPVQSPSNVPLSSLKIKEVASPSPKLLETSHPELLSPAPSVPAAPQTSPTINRMVVPAPAVPSVPSDAPRVRTMVTDVEAMQPKGKQPVQNIPLPRAPLPPQVPSAPTAVVRPAPITPKAPAPDPAQVTADLKKYGVDPYREPVE